MQRYEYTAEDALRLLRARIESKEPSLATRIQTAIDSGKQELKKVEEPSDSGRGKKRKRQYWITVPYSDEEALQVAITVLESHLVESRMMLDHALGDFEKVGEAEPKPIKRPPSVETAEFALERDLPIESIEVAAPQIKNVNTRKALYIEGQPEQQQAKVKQEDHPLSFTPSDQLYALKELITNLERLMHFSGGENADAR